MSTQLKTSGGRPPGPPAADAPETSGGRPPGPPAADALETSGGRPPEPPAPAGAVHRLGSIDQIPYGEGRAYDVGGEQVAVFRLRNGHVYALSAVCTHRGGPIADGQTDSRIVMCPLHQNTFELATGCSPTGAEPLRRYHVVLEGEEIVLTV